MEQLKKKLAAIDAEITAILAGDITADDQARYDKLSAQYAQTAAMLKAEEKRQADLEAERERTQAATVAAERAANRVQTTRTVDMEPPTANRTPTLPNSGGVTLGAIADGVSIDGFTPNSMCGVPNSMRYTGRLHGQYGGPVFRGSRRVTLTGTNTTLNLSSEQRAYRFGMWLLGALGRQHHAYANTEACIKADAWVRENMPGVNAYVTSTDASGYQFTIPIEFSRDIIDLREYYGVARRLLRMEEMVSDKKMIPRRQSGLTAYWTSEGGIITPSNKIWNDVELVAKDLTAISVVSAQVNADTIVPWAADLADEIAYAMALAEDNAAFIGTGLSATGKITGIAQRLLTPGSDSNPSAGLYTMSGSSAGWSGITLANIQAIIGLLPQYADSPRCTFLSHRTFFFTVIQPLLTALGGVTYMEGTTTPNAGTQEGYGARPMVLGYPWTFSQVMPNTNASGQIPLYFGDFTKGAAFGNRQDPQIAFSDQGYVAGVSLFERNLLGIRGTERLDINIHDVGTSNTMTPASLPGPIVGGKTS